jgi:hypothetical protein
MKIWKWHCRFKTKKWRNETTLQTLTIREWRLNREISSKTIRIQQTPGIAFSPRASFSRHPQYTPAPSVYRYRACIKLFAAPSIEHDPLYPSRSPVSVSIPSCSHARTAMWPGIPTKIKKNSYYITIYHSNRHLLRISVIPHFSKKSNFFKF